MVYGHLSEKVEALRTDLSALRYMQDKPKSPKLFEVLALPGGGEFKVGQFWRDCKRKRRCSGPPYARLLDNAVLGEDYRAPQGRRGTRERSLKVIRLFDSTVMLLIP